MATFTSKRTVIGTSSFKEVGMGATNLAIYKEMWTDTSSFEGIGSGHP